MYAKKKNQCWEESVMFFELQNGTKSQVGQDYGCCTGITADVFGTDFFFFWLRTRNTCGSCCLKLVKT